MFGANWRVSLKRLCGCVWEPCASFERAFKSGQTGQASIRQTHSARTETERERERGERGREGEEKLGSVSPTVIVNKVSEIREEPGTARRLLGGDCWLVSGDCFDRHLIVIDYCAVSEVAHTKRLIYSIIHSISPFQLKPDCLSLNLLQFLYTAAFLLYTSNTCKASTKTLVVGG